jgi:hypothetical protein
MRVLPQYSSSLEFKLSWPLLCNGQTGMSVLLNRRLAMRHHPQDSVDREMQQQVGD